MSDPDPKKGSPRRLECPVCHVPVLYDPDDPMHHTGGAMLRKPGDPKPTIVYLTCENRHLQRYTVG